MAKFYISGQQGNLLIIGSSTDTKDTPLQNGWSFFELNTGKTFYSENGLWEENKREERSVIIFTGQTSKSVIFLKPFKQIPNIVFSNNDNSIQVNYKQNVSVNGFTMRFPVPYTGTVDWYAKEK